MTGSQYRVLNTLDARLSPLSWLLERRLFKHSPQSHDALFTAS